LFFSTQYDGLWCTTNLTAPAPNFFAVTNYPFKQPVRIFYDPYDTNRLWVTSFGHGMYVGLFRTNATPPVAFPPGDVNDDQHVTGSDSLLINQVLVGLRNPTSAVFQATGFANGDVNRDTAVAGADSLLINQVAVGLRSYLTTRIEPGSRLSTEATPIIIYGVGFPTNATPSVHIAAPVGLALSNVTVVSRERIAATVPPGGGLGTGKVEVVGSPAHGVLSFGEFVNQ
jgi:hypothetical protein